MQKNEMSAFEKAIAEAATANTYRTYIGIDPDIDMSGWAIWEAPRQRLAVDTASFTEIVAVLNNLRVHDTDRSTKVVLEAGWLNKVSNFHQYVNPAVGMRIAAKVGQNHAVGKLIEQLLIEYEIPYELVRPSSAKWDAKQFKTLTGLTQRTNSEMRDAAKLVYGR